MKNKKAYISRNVLGEKIAQEVTILAENESKGEVVVQYWTKPTEVTGGIIPPHLVKKVVNKNEIYRISNGK